MSLSASGEIAQPSRTIPRALAIAMLSVTFLYISIQVIAQGILGPSLATSTVPLADGMARVSPALRHADAGGAGLSMFGWHWERPSRQSSYPVCLRTRRIAARAPWEMLHPRTHTPHVAILCYAALVIGFALTGTFAELAVLATLATAPSLHSRLRLGLDACAAWCRVSRHSAQFPLSGRSDGNRHYQHADSGRPGVPRRNRRPGRANRSLPNHPRGFHPSPLVGRPMFFCRLSFRVC